ncbi:uncharacterized protein LOC132544812 [Ylistrum balloti]|uniref:uncharacterized protein LOC132544812 n=1 Tax=Ylistrum balloti TaxID=509963 RepID=UPI002905882D|nr:uncharacterized protein LOC132544812 [Ylistrum balloti]
MSGIQDLMILGKDAGLAGQDLLDFVSRIQAEEREERRRLREEEQASRDHELRKLEQEKELIHAKRAAAEKEAQLRFELEKESEAKALREHARRREIMEMEQKEPAKVKVEHGLHLSKRGPKLPPFDEATDSVDSYLQRFERYATTQQWSKEHEWAANLSVLLKGRALDVFSRLPIEEFMRYDILKSALLRRFEMTEDGFRKRFRSGRPEAGETCSQFGVRLESYFVKWLDMSGTEKTFNHLKDLMVRDQFLQSCGSDLMLFLKERAPTSLASMTKLADQYAEARGNPPNLMKQRNQGGKNSESHQNKGSSDSSRISSGKTAHDDTKHKYSSRQCYNCKSTDHLMNNCPHPRKKSGNTAAAVSDE